MNGISNVEIHLKTHSGNVNMTLYHFQDATSYDKAMFNRGSEAEPRLSVEIPAIHGFRENFIFANSVKTRIWGVENRDKGVIYLYQ